VARTRQRLYRFALHTLGNPQDAEDVTQEALTRAWTHFEHFDQRRSFEAWVFRIVSNLTIDQSRRRRRRQEVSLDAPPTYLSEYDGRCRPEPTNRSGDPQNSLMAKEISAELQSALRSLPRRHQVILMLVAQQHSYEQIAKAFDCPLGTVRSRVHRARIMLRHNLKESTPYEG
jgi:RNA polymerase sigma-70 factor (ECF subfamily)